MMEDISYLLKWQNMLKNGKLGEYMLKRELINQKMILQIVSNGRLEKILLFVTIVRI